MKNLLIDFLRSLPPDLREKLWLQITPRGQHGAVWSYAFQASSKKDFSKTATLKELRITPSHFDKICSELLQKCYSVLVPERGFALITFLNSHVSWSKHFYNELNHQLKTLHALSAKEAQSFLRNCFACFWDMPIVNRNEKMFKKIGEAYLSFSDSSSQNEDKLFVSYLMLRNKMDSLFAADKLLAQEKKLENKIKRLTPDFSTARNDTIFEYYQTYINLKHAAMRFEDVLQLIEDALQKLSKYDSENVIQLRLKQAELLYYVSRFDDSYNTFRELLKTNEETYNNIGYFYTKYVQVCLITGRLDTAKWILEYKKAKRGDLFEEVIIPRDIISFAKYHLFAGEYEEAFSFIRLGYSKNPKGKYFQYEVELRMLETAYFYLAGDPQQALSLCRKNIAYLHSKGYRIKKDIYPQFFVLIKALFEHRKSGRKLMKREEATMHEYMQGSRAVYGQILQKIQEAKV